MIAILLSNIDLVQVSFDIRHAEDSVHWAVSEVRSLRKILSAERIL